MKPIMEAAIEEPAIEVRGLTKRFDAKVAVDAVSFNVARGSTTALLGGNGAARPPPLSMLLGLLLPTAGSIQVLGEDMLRHRYRVLPRMNFSSPYVEVPRRLTVAQNLTVYGHLYGLRQVRRRIAALAADLDMVDFLDRPTGQLSPVSARGSRSPRR